VAAYHVTNRTFCLSYPAFHRSNGDNAMHKVSIVNDSPADRRKQHLRIEGSRSGGTVLDVTSAVTTQPSASSMQPTNAEAYNQYKCSLAAVVP
jgi:hypothetical protein